ncbi:hypothetical protein BKA70DRAFT_1566711 [Coprinopsis sp. MPI-PUGE-AT-0042]|nr:hypothetical protein BKA70DRAFT_1566711 [Coprinopsis sp. MPI-PUGE-AT-0042]
MPPNTTQVESSTASPVFAILKGKATSTVNISGGTWNNVEGNQSFQFIGCNVALNTRVGLGASTHASTSSSHHTCSTSRRTPRTDEPPAPVLDHSPSVHCQFLLVKNALRFVKQLVALQKNETRIIERVIPQLHDLEVLVDFSSSAHDACSGGTVLGKLIKAAIAPHYIAYTIKRRSH